VNLQDLQWNKTPGRIGEQQQASITATGNRKGDAQASPFLFRVSTSTVDNKDHDPTPLDRELTCKLS
jgi:hypothetical protein